LRKRKGKENRMKPAIVETDAPGTTRLRRSETSARGGDDGNGLVEPPSITIDILLAPICTVEGEK
jgi:hypothetical protein